MLTPAERKAAREVVRLHTIALREIPALHPGCPTAIPFGRVIEAEYVVEYKVCDGGWRDEIYSVRIPSQ